MSIFVCPECAKHIDTDFHTEDVYSDGENDPICMDCREDYEKRQYAYWKPLYDGEVQAGIAGPNLMRLTPRRSH